MSVPSILDKNDEISPLSVPASETAVMLLDYHQYLFTRIDEADAARVVEGAKALKAWAKESGTLIIHGLIDVAGPMFPTMKSRKRLASTMDLMKKSPGAGIEHPDIAPSPDVDSGREVTLVRTLGQFSAMKSRGLEELLKKNGVRSLLIGGISTSGCAMRTALQAADDGFIVTMLEDACADPLPSVHETVLRSIVIPNVHVTTTAGWILAWEKAYGL